MTRFERRCYLGTVLRRFVLLIAFSALASCSTSERSPSPPELDDTEGRVPAEIAWETFEAGIEHARRDHKPVVVVFTATWCTQCQTYRSVLANPNVIALSRRFVMIRVDITDQPGINQRYAFDGTYVPRTMFFSADGAHRAELRSPSRDRFAYFLNPRDPSELLTLMTRALEAS